MYRDIVVGWDATEGARDALALARLLLAPGGVITSACVHTAPDVPRTADALTPKEATDALGEARSEAEPGATWLAPAAVEARTAPDGLRAAIDGRHSALLAIGSSRYGPIGQVHTGGVGRALVSAPPCAIALPPRRFASHAPAPERIGVVFDGAHQLGAVAEASRIAASSGAALHVFCVMPELARWARGAGEHVGYAWESVSRQHHAHYHELLDQAVAGLDPQPVAARVVERSSAADVLAETSRRIDLLVTGPPASGDLQRLVAGVTSGTLHSAHCPVLICAHTSGAVAPDSAGSGAARA